MEPEDRELQWRKFHLDFYTAQLSTHSRLLIGFTAILFTIVKLTFDLRARTVLDVA